MEFNTTLLRERFVIRESQEKSLTEPPITAVSNRMTVSLTSRSGHIHEKFIVRSQSMHLCIRVAAKIVQTFQQTGPLMARAERFDFEGTWNDITAEHEQKFNPDRWICVYHFGKPVFSAGNHHQFLDMVEKCDAINPGSYDDAVHLAEDTFAKMGRNVAITHDANIGLVISVRPGMSRCGLIFRNPNHQTTFNFTAESKEGSQVSISHCLNIAAAHLEGIQLAFRLGTLTEKIRKGVFAAESEEDKESISAGKRLVRLSTEIGNFEDMLTVRYRPEKPDFSRVVEGARKFANTAMKER